MTIETIGLLILLFALVLALFWWLIIHTEGVYLGRGMVAWLYDMYAGRYDGIKENDDVDEHLYIAQPLLERIQPQLDPLVLDVACGTGRMAIALCQHARFEGHILGMDISRGMLLQAHQRLEEEHFRDYVELIRASAQELPFEDGAFDVVTCMEALEFMPDPAQTLGELQRVLRPGGLLLMTLRINMRWMPGRLWSADTLRQKLMTYGFDEPEFIDWQMDYQLVWARKGGESLAIGPRPAIELLTDTRAEPDAETQIIDLLPNQR